jgi:hypothetical protein
MGKQQEGRWEVPLVAVYARSFDDVTRLLADIPPAAEREPRAHRLAAAIRSVAARMRAVPRSPVRADEAR